MYQNLFFKHLEFIVLWIYRYFIVAIFIVRYLLTNVTKWFIHPAYSFIIMQLQIFSFFRFWERERECCIIFIEVLINHYIIRYLKKTIVYRKTFFQVYFQLESSIW